MTDAILLVLLIQKKHFKIDLEGTQKAYLLDRLALSSDIRNDWGRIRLKSPIPNIKALDADFSGTQVQKNDTLIMISRVPPELKGMYTNQLTIQSCEIKNMRTSVSRSTALYMDCDNFRGMSGALLFKRREDGALVPKAFLAGMNERIGNFKEWD